MTSKNTQKYCFTRYHMTMRQYGLYSAVRELQSKWGFIYFDGDDLAASFKKTSRDFIFRDCKALIAAGWFEEKSPRNRKKDGTWEARKIVAITHKEWTAKYPNQCNLDAQPVAPVQLDEALSSSTCTTDQSHLCNGPVAPVQLTGRTLATKTWFNTDMVHNSKVQGGRVPPAPDGFVEVVEFCSVVSDSAIPTTKDKPNALANTTSIPDIPERSIVASELAKGLVIKSHDYTDPLAGSPRGAMVRDARKSDHPFNIAGVCTCCHIKLAIPDSSFCRDCDDNCDGPCEMKDTFIKMHQERGDGWDWRDSAFVPFNMQRLMTIAGRVITRAVLTALHSTPENALANLDRVLLLIEYRIESIARRTQYKTVGGVEVPDHTVSPAVVIGMIEDLSTTALLLTRHCEKVAGVTVLDNSPVAAETGSCEI